MTVAPDLPAIAGLFDLTPRDGADWATRLGMARELGRVWKRTDGNWQVDVARDGERFRIGSVRLQGTDTWVSIASERMANDVLYAIRSRYAARMKLSTAVSPFVRRPLESTRIEHLVARFLAYQEKLCDSGDISPNTLKDLRRYAREGTAEQRPGEFARWAGWDVNAITYGALEDWRVELGASGKAAKTALNIMGEFRRMLRWLYRRGELSVVPEFPRIPIDQRPPQTLTPEEQEAVIAAVPYPRRGIFLAMAHTLREGEARALDLLRWREPYLIVQRAAKLATASAPIRGLKERDWKVVAATDELVEWIRWRLDRLTAAERLRREDVLLFPNWTARNDRRLWSAWTLIDEWKAACARAGVPYVSPYPSTRHTTATDLIRRGASMKAVQTLLGHRSAKSTERYVVLAGVDAQDLIRRYARDLMVTA